MVDGWVGAHAYQCDPSSVKAGRPRLGLCVISSKPEAAPSQPSEQVPCCALDAARGHRSSVPASKTKPPRKANLVPLSTLKAGCHINNPHNRPIRSIHSVLVFSSPQLLFQSCASLSMLLGSPPQKTNVTGLTKSLFTIKYRTHALTAGAARRRLGEPPGRQRRGRPSRHPAPCRPRRAAESPWDPTACAS